MARSPLLSRVWKAVTFVIMCCRWVRSLVSFFLSHLCYADNQSRWILFFLKHLKCSRSILKERGQSLLKSVMHQELIFTLYSPQSNTSVSCLLSFLNTSGLREASIIVI